MGHPFVDSRIGSTRYGAFGVGDLPLGSNHQEQAPGVTQIAALGEPPRSVQSDASVLPGSSLQSNQCLEATILPSAIEIAHQKTRRALHNVSQKFPKF